LLVGDGPEYDAVVDRAAASGIRDVTVMPGFVDPTEVGRYIDPMDICYGVIDPDRVGSPMKVYEYLGRGRPVVVTTDPEFKFVEQIGAGALVDTPTGRAVADALERLLDVSPERRTEMGAAGREYVKRRGLTWEGVATQILDGL
jgi:glycosyltransferase involved in cell wall biosynthesis